MERHAPEQCILRSDCVAGRPNPVQKLVLQEGRFAKPSVREFGGKAVQLSLFKLLGLKSPTTPYGAV